jgi:hypothetical protein
VAQEKERQKNASLPDSTTIGMGQTEHQRLRRRKGRGCAPRDSVRWKKQRRELLKRSREWRLGMAYRDEQRTSVSLRGEHTKRAAPQRSKPITIVETRHHVEQNVYVPRIGSMRISAQRLCVSCIALLLLPCLRTSTSSAQSTRVETVKHREGHPFAPTADAVMPELLREFAVPGSANVGNVGQ